ncbi:hypothetical protein JXB01_03065 [Candidatus Micrarchaeota archaeon]|nr:hypothetical protein [Candidatus Micrarchaeota archaeon]
MSEIEQLHNEIERIKERNRKVELDKSWETSWSRKVIIAVLTYLVIVLFFFVAQLPNPFVNSIVPTAGFAISTLSLPFFRDLWVKYIYR